MKLFLILLFLSLKSFSTENNFASQIRLASDKTQSMTQRWNSLVKAADLANVEQINVIKDFSKSSEWYMRNASLVALAKVNLPEAQKQAKLLMHDPALVVRSAAVDVLAMELNEENKNLLFNELSKPYNFNKKNSLWIRKQIIEKFFNVAASADKSYFIKSLFDTDKEVALLSAKALEKITGKNVGSENFLEKWKALVREKSGL